MLTPCYSEIIRRPGRIPGRLEAYLIKMNALGDRRRKIAFQNKKHVRSGMKGGAKVRFGQRTWCSSIPTRAFQTCFASTKPLKGCRRRRHYPVGWNQTDHAVDTLTVARLS